MIQKRPIFASKPIGLSSESAPLSRLCKHPLPFYVLTSVLLFYFDRKSKHFRNVILYCDLRSLFAKSYFKLRQGNPYIYSLLLLKFYRKRHGNNVLKLKNRF